MKKAVFNNHLGLCLLSVLCSRAKAVAFIMGGESYPDIVGSVLFYQTSDGVVVFAEISGLPKLQGACDDGIFGFHIHKGTD